MMEHPRRITKEWFVLHNSFGANWFISGSGVHPNPHMYKYDWWIYPANSPYASAEDIFYKSEHRLSTKSFYEMAKQLNEEKISFAYVNSKERRLGNKIWDYEKIKQEYPDTEFAPAFYDDPDEAYEGHK